MKQSKLRNLTTFLLLSAAVFAVGCKNPLGRGGSYGSSVDPGYSPGIPPVGVSTVGSTNGFKIAPSSVKANNENITILSSITATNSGVSGVSIGARLSINKTQVR